VTTGAIGRTISQSSQTVTTSKPIRSSYGLDALPVTEPTMSEH